MLKFCCLLGTEKNGLGLPWRERPQVRLVSVILSKNSMFSGIFCKFSVLELLKGRGRDKTRAAWAGRFVEWVKDKPKKLAQGGRGVCAKTACAFLVFLLVKKPKS